MTEMSARFALPFIQPGQAQKEIAHNHALARLDALVHLRIVSDTEAAPPATPALGDCWIVPPAAAVAWGMPAHAVAAWTETRQIFAWFDGLSWRLDGWPVAGILTSAGAMLRGARLPMTRPSGGTHVDAEARAVLNALIDAMEQHGLISV